MKKLTPAAIALLKSLAEGRGNYATHRSTRAALTDRGFMVQEAGRWVITEAGTAFVTQLTDAAVKAV